MTNAGRSIAVRLRRPKLVAHLATRHLSVLGLDHDAELGAAAHVRIERQDEVALLRPPGIAGIRARSARAGHSSRGRCHRASTRARSSKSPPLAADFARSPGARALRGLEGHELLVERLDRGRSTSVRNWWSGEFMRVGSSSWASFAAFELQTVAGRMNGPPGGAENRVLENRAG